MLNGIATNESLKKVITDFTAIFEAWLRDAGTGPYAGRILMTILLSDKPLTQKEIADKTGYSVSTISRHVKLVTDSTPPLVIKSRVPNSKEWQYERRHDTSTALLSGMILSFSSSLRNNIVTMERALMELESINEELLEGFAAQQFTLILQNLLSASRVMVDELDKLLKSFQSQITET